MSGGGKGGGSQTVTQSVEIPPFLRPFVENAAETADDALNRLDSRLSGATASDLVSPLTPDQLQSIELARNFALGENSPLNTTLDTLNQTARGDFLFGGPGFNEAIDAAVDRVQPRILSTFGSAGRGTGLLAQDAIARTVGDAFALQFGNERQRQLSAASALPTVGSLPSSILGDIGGRLQGQNQRELTAPISAQESLLAAAKSGLPVQSLLSTTTTQPTQSNPLGSILGAGLSLAGLFSGNPFAAIGGGFGGLNTFTGNAGLGSFFNPTGFGASFL